MLELLALPAWNLPTTPLERWVEAIKDRNVDVLVTRESTGVCWVEIASVRLRGYAVMQGSAVEAINFELLAPDPAPARALVEGAASSLGWEIHEDDGIEVDD